MQHYEPSKEKKFFGLTPKQFAIVAGMFFLAIVVIAGAITYVLRPSEKWDKETGCPIVKNEIRPSGQTVILIDTTDPLTENQKDQVRNLTKRIIKEQTRPGDLVTVYALNQEALTLRKPAFEMCSLRDGSDASKWTENSRLMKKKFEEKFNEPITKAIEQTSESKPDTASPIFEMIQLAGIRSFQKWNVQGEKRLIIFSDLLHNTPDFSLYQNAVPDFESFKKSDYRNRVISDLKDVDVTLYIFQNDPARQKQALSTFWKDYFASLGAQVSRVTPLGQ